MAKDLDIPHHFYMLTDKQYHCHVNTRGINEVITGVMKLCLEFGVERNDHGVRIVDDAIAKFLQCEKVKHEAQAYNKNKKNTWFGIHSKKFLDKTYKDLDATNLLEIIPKVTKIRPGNKDNQFQTLWKSILKIRNIRNDVVHLDNNATYSEQTMNTISVIVNEIVDNLAKLFSIQSTEVDLIKTKFQNEIQMIQDPQPRNEHIIKSKIQESIIKENADKWVPKIMESMQFEKLQFGNELLSRSDMFHVTEFEVMSELHQNNLYNHDNPEGQDKKDRKTIVCTDILADENNTHIDIIEGDPGSGKSTFLRMISLEFCKKQTNSIFLSISSFVMMILINCRDKENICSFWQYFETHYRDTALLFPVKWVTSALREMKMIIAIDGLDEANKASTTLVCDVIHIFAGSETVRFLITTRPGFSRKVVEQFDKEAIRYRVLNIKPIDNIDGQEKFIGRIIKQIPTIKVEDIMKSFITKRDELNSHFLRPIGLILFISMFHYFPEEIKKMTHELSLMRLSFKMHSVNMTERMPVEVRNPELCSKKVMKQLGTKSLQLIQNNSYEVDEVNFDSLQEECNTIDKNIPLESVISCVLMKRKCTKVTIKAIHDFAHHCQQEYFASKVLTERLLQERSKRYVFPEKRQVSSRKVKNLIRKFESNEILVEDPKTSEDPKISEEPTEILKILQELTREPVAKKDLARLVL